MRHMTRKDDSINVKQLERDDPWGWEPVPADFRLRESSDGKVTLQRRWEHVCGVSAWRDVETIVADTPLPPSKEESK